MTADRPPHPEDEIRGLIPILATPFDAAGSVDYASLRGLTEFQLTSGADGVAVAGMASEAFALTGSERDHILREVVTVVNHAVPVISGISATSAAVAREQAVSAQELGADWLMALPPFMVRPTRPQLIDFYAELATSVSIPIMVQDAPGVTGVTMTPDLICELMKIDNICSVKVESPPTTRKVAAVVAHLNGSPGTILGGQNAQFCLEEYQRGAVGTMPACEFTDLLTPVLNLWLADEQHEARHQFTRLLPLIIFGLQQGIAWGVHKYVLLRRGLIADDTVRMPAQRLNDADRHSIDTILGALGADLVTPGSTVR